MYEGAMPVACSTSSSSRISSPEREASVEHSLDKEEVPSQTTVRNNIEENDNLEASVQAKVLELPALRGVGDVGAAPENQISASKPIPNIPVALEYPPRSRSRKVGLAESFSGKPSSFRPCGASCSHENHEGSSITRE